MAGLVGLSAAPTLIHKKCSVFVEWQQCGSCGAAFDKVTEVHNGPEAPKKDLAISAKNLRLLLRERMPRRSMSVVRSCWPSN
jgi:hypothetical protein